MLIRTKSPLANPQSAVVGSVTSDVRLGLALIGHIGTMILYAARGGGRR